MTTHPQHATTQAHHNQQDNGLAIASLVLGITSLTGFGALTGIPAIITGFMSLKNPVNKGMGIAGLVMGCISTVLTLLVIFFFFLVIIIAAASGSTPSQEMPTPMKDTYESADTRSI